MLIKLLQFMRRMVQGDIQLRRLRRNRRCREKPKLVTKHAYPFSLILISSILITSCREVKYASYTPQIKLAPDKLKADLVLLKKIIEANHPSLYWYTPKDSVDLYFNETLQSINDSLTEFQFRKKVSWFIAKLRCGHTSVR